MTEFTVSADLDVEVDPQSLSDARDEIEAALGGVQAGVEADVSGGGAAGAQASRRRRLEFQWRRENNENLTEILNILDDAEFGGGGGGIAAELLGTAGETAGDVAIETADEATDVIKDFATTAAGNLVDDLLPGRDGGGGGGERVTRRREAPTVDVDTDLSPTFDPTFESTFEPVFKPTIQPTFEPTLNIDPNVDLPDFNFGGGDGSIQTPHPVTVENTPIDVSLQDSIGGGGSNISIGFGSSGSGQRRRGPFERVGRGLDQFSTETASRFSSEGQNNPTNILGRAGRFADEVNPFVNTGGGGGGSTNNTVNVNINRGDTEVNVDGNFEQVVTDAIEELRREQERKIDEIERQLNSLERQIDAAASGGGASGGTSGANVRR